MLRKFVLLSAIAGTEVAVIGLVLPQVAVGGGEMEAIILSVILTGWFFISFWLSVGSTRAPIRQIVCVSILGVVGVIASVIDRQPEMSVARALNFIAVSWYLYAALYLPRLLVGMKLTYGGRERRTPPKRQFGIGALLSLMAVISLPFALSRLAFAVHPQALSESLLLTAILAVVVVTVLPLGIAAFSNRGATLKISLSLLWCVVATLIVEHFMPPDYAGGGPVFALTWFQIAALFFVARLLGVRWEVGGQTEVAKSLRGDGGRLRWLQSPIGQLLSLALAMAAGWMLVSTPLLFQFSLFYVFIAAAPLLIVALPIWRQQSIDRFWVGVLAAGALPWVYAMVVSSKEAWILLFGTPRFLSVSPVEVGPTHDYVWPELLAVLLLPLLAGALGGVCALARPGLFGWRRRAEAAIGASSETEKTAVSQSISPR